MTLRPFNTFGPRQSARAVIPTVLSPAAGRAPRAPARRRCTPQRDFTFVTDTAVGFARAAVADLAPGTTVQLGTGRTVSIGEIVELCIDDHRHRGRGRHRGRAGPPRRARRSRSCCPTRRGQGLLGWKPTGRPRDRAAAHGRLAPRVDADLARRTVPPMSDDARALTRLRAPGPAGTIPLAVPNVGERRTRCGAGRARLRLRLVGRPAGRRVRAGVRRARRGRATPSPCVERHRGPARRAAAGRRRRRATRSLVSDFTFVGSANPVAYQGADVVLVDSEAGTWNMDPDPAGAEFDRRAAAGEPHAEGDRARPRPRPARRCAAASRRSRDRVRDLADRGRRREPRRRVGRRPRAGFTSTGTLGARRARSRSTATRS